MSCQQLTMRKLLNQKYEEYVPNLNPFSNILFNENWSWPQVHIPQTLGPKTKTSAQKNSSIKLDVTNWFFSLSHEQKCAVTMIKNQHFLQNMLQTYHQWNPSQLYHIYQHRKIPNYISKNSDIDTTKHLIEHFCIAWLDQPILYFDLDFLQSELFFQKFINWMNTVSNLKIFQYAHKIKNKLDPQENILWFTDKSFQSFQAWIVNQFQKVITKNYFNKNNYDLDYYSKMRKLRSGLSTSQNNQVGGKKQLQNLLCTKFNDTKNKTELDFKQWQQKVKTYQDQYYEQVSLLMDFEKNQLGKQKNEENIKKKKKKSKKKNKKKQTQAKNEGNNQAEENDDQKQQVSPQKQILEESKIVEQEKINQNENETEVATQTNIQQIIDPNSNQYKLQSKKLQQNLNIKIVHQPISPQIKIQIKQTIEQQPYNEPSQSGNSEQWSNVQTTKTTKKSGQSHPEFNQFDRQKEKQNQLKNKRSLSPDENNSISKLKKRRGHKRNNKNAISSWNGDESNNQNFMESYQGGNQSSPYRQRTIQKQQSEPIVEKKDSENQQPQQIQKKKKKKSSKSATMLKQLASKVSSSLMSRQINNFIDSLSIETNNLYDHKIVSFERVRFFIQSLFPTTQPILFGSNAVGLSLPTSDIDIMLLNLPCSCRQEAIEILAHLAVQINTMGWIVSCSTYLNAKVPLIKLQIDPTVQYAKTKRKCDYLGLMLDPRILQHLQLKPKLPQKQTNSQLPQNNIIKVDLTINIQEQGFLGGQSTQLMKLWMNRYPQIYMCVLAFKYVLAQRGFSSNFKGGIGSYCLFVMIAAYIREFPELQQLDDGEFFLSTLKFYGQDFENQIKSIILRPFEQTPNYITGQLQTCFITLEETMNQLNRQYPQQDNSLLYTIQTNPLRIFDPINNRIMSGSCHLYPQIKSQFRRIYKELIKMKQICEKEVELTVGATEVSKMLENRKTMDKWLNKYQVRNRVCIKDILNGGF